MSIAGIAFLTLVVGGLSIFGLVLGFVAWWSDRPTTDVAEKARPGRPVSVSTADGHLA
jgi:hypothetical protein